MMDTIEQVAKLPESLQTIVELTNWSTMVALVESYGGCQIHFPPSCNVSEEHEIAKIIGVDNLRKLVRYFDAETIYIASATYVKTIRDQQIYAEARARTKTNSHLAREHGVSERWIRNIISQGHSPKQYLTDIRQPDLFSEP
jgi:hypothetical protein